MSYSDIDKKAASLSLLAYNGYTIKDGHVECLLEADDDSCWIAFRGTAKNESNWSLIRDIISDVRFIPTKNPNIGWVPRGFLYGAVRITDDIERTIRKTFKISLTGHSLGGVLAEIVGALLISRGFHVEHIRTFNAPHGGSLDILNAVDVVAYRYGRDVVSKLPPIIPRHSKAVRIGEKGKIFQDHAMIKCYEETLNA